ncbi:MAG TPA: hypothetical protein VLI92_01295 [Candidatus Saccharimonadales bacterium]|nr:hypothetical protein [Candidatus Saccharimonadales bacterium]
MGPSDLAKAIYRKNKRVYLKPGFESAVFLLLASLSSPMDREVLIRFYGLRGITFGSSSLQELAEHGSLVTSSEPVTVEKVKRIIDNAVEKLRVREQSAKVLAPYIFGRPRKVK